jgi:hypothetical protein
MIVVDQSELLSPAVEQSHDPGSRFAAVVFVGIVCTGAAASSGEVTLAMSLGVTRRASDLGISVRHGEAAI